MRAEAILRESDERGLPISYAPCGAPSPLATPSIRACAGSPKVLPASLNCFFVGFPAIATSVRFGLAERRSTAPAGSPVSAARGARLRARRRPWAPLSSHARRSHGRNRRHDGRELVWSNDGVPAAAWLFRSQAKSILTGLTHFQVCPFHLLEPRSLVDVVPNCGAKIVDPSEVSGGDRQLRRGIHKFGNEPNHRLCVVFAAKIPDLASLRPEC
jgi:hypothetical protein